MALEQLRAFRAGRSLDTLGATVRLEPDGYPLLASSELAAEHELLGPLLASLVGHRAGEVNTNVDLHRLGADDAESRTRVYLAILERVFAHNAKLCAVGNHTFSHVIDYGGAAGLLSQLLGAGVVAERVIEATLDWFNSYRFVYYSVQPLVQVIELVQAVARQGALSAQLRSKLIHVHGQCRDLGGYERYGDDIVAPLEALLGSGVWQVLAPCEVWSASIVAELEALPAPTRALYTALLTHCAAATAARPSEKWLRLGKAHLEATGRGEFRQALMRWLPLVDRARPEAMVGPGWESMDEQQRMHQENATVLRGLLWLAPEVADPELTRAIGKVVLSAYRKVRGIGPRAPKVGNAGVYALSRVETLDAVGQLAVLKVRVKTATAQKEVEKAFNVSAESLGLPRDEIEELGIPTYGMDEVGLRREQFEDAEAYAEIRVEGREARLGWFKKDGKSQKSVPAKIKSDHRDELKELQSAAKDIGAMLTAQSERLDGMFLLEKRWPLGAWRERYLDHPLVGTLARRLIWTFVHPNTSEKIGIWRDGAVRDVMGRPIEPPAETVVRLWHPIGRDVSETLAWRALLEQYAIQQPFKQAHREVYLLTEAERRTGTYSNRFAAHVLRQHQFNALCAARGWRNKLRLMVDDSYPPARRELPHWGLRAEYWIEGIGDDHGRDTNESGAFLRVATDQVRFYRSDAVQNSAHAGGGGYTTWAEGPGPADANMPLPLEQVPALVLSEILRDVDLFVGVGSVGNDPDWQDGGPEGRFRTYWHAYSFGDLSETAKTRRSVLERLIPRLKIAERCRFDDKFLVVRGDLRTYKIHLGSGNILMEPNDQYLCIVQARSSAADAADKVFLPFEGDSTLSLVLSKAFLLAADKKISDPSITRQIEG
jgi:hypothetical protein